VIAKFLLGVYFGHSDPGSTYGAAGSIILIMLWVSYAGLILLFGAEFTQVYADRHGRKILPTDVAVSTEGETDNGAIVNKKTEAESKAKGDRKTRTQEASQKRKRNEPRKNPSKQEKKLSFSRFVLYVFINKIRRVFS
jgi:uncharacterized BrkB/YihY/UPF0761 family membrane protein